jgi:hypothetical protein
MEEFSDKLYEILIKLPRKNLINIMWGALDEMQSYNGQSRQGCILEAMGAEKATSKSGSFKYKLPKTLAEIKRNTHTMGL